MSSSELSTNSRRFGTGLALAIGRATVVIVVDDEEEGADEVISSDLMTGGSVAETFKEFKLDAFCTCFPDLPYAGAFLLEGVVGSVSGINTGASELTLEFDMVLESEPERARRPRILLLLSRLDVLVSCW